MLRELAELGMKVARGMAEDEPAAGEENTPAAPASRPRGLDFHRAAKAVRQTLVLYRLVEEGALAETLKAQAERAARAAARQT
ncbi:MAG TPA: hypothetical protein VF459_10185, partial [Caulobacteraceae bacterium]